ncbi:MAG: hypothetical protein ACREDL_04670 [Bradyrhizobium sp.]
MAMIGPENSGSGEAMAPILSEGGLATITHSSTNPDLTNPKFATEFDPSGKPIGSVQTLGGSRGLRQLLGWAGN